MSENEDDRLVGILFGKDRYRLGKKITAGSFGEIREGIIIATGEKVAVKLESVEVPEKQLLLEWNFYRALDCLTPNSPLGFPRCHSFTKVDKYSALVMEWLGPTLENKFQSCNQQFTFKTVCQLARQLIDRFEYIHSKHMLYRDIKPENFLLGDQDNPLEKNIVHIVDFGLSKFYIDEKTKAHVLLSANRRTIGTLRYMSIKSLFKYEQCRRDDLEAVGYVLLYFASGGKLPWMGLAGSTQERVQKIANLKQDTLNKIDEYCEQRNIPKQLADYMKCLREVSFEQRPNYDKLKSFFSDYLIEQNLPFDEVYDWDLGNIDSNLTNDTTTPDAT